MVLSTLALVGIIQLILLLAGGIFFLLLHTRFLKKQIRTLKGENPSEDATSEPPPPVQTATTETPSTTDAPATDAGPDTDTITGEISELRKMLDEKLLLTANMRKLIESLTDNPDAAEEIAKQQQSSLIHLEEYIHHSQKEAAAVEDKVTHYREQLAKAKKLLVKYKDQQSATEKSTDKAPDEET